MSLYKYIETEDKSETLFSEIYQEHYHSTFGALNESLHIFIEAGLQIVDKDDISIFEMGFGTGLNALLTLQYAIENKKNIEYHTVEKHVLEKQIISKLNPISELEESFIKLHLVPWEQRYPITDRFSISKHETGIEDYIHQSNYDLIYYDAFSPDTQPELWSETIFKRIYERLNAGGLLLTYTVKGDVKRALKSVGFEIEKLPGPKGKREILRARKN